MQKIIEKLFNISHDASATLIITIFIFFLGYLITWLGVSINNFLKRRLTSRIFIDNLNSLSKSIEKQEKLYLKTIKSIDIIENTPWVFGKVDFFQTNVFKEMSYKGILVSFFYGNENLLKYLNRKLRRRSYNKFWENLNSIEFWTNRAYYDLHRFIDRYNVFGTERNDEIDKLRQYWEQLFENGKTVTDEGIIEYLKALDIIIFEYSKIPTKKRVGPFITQRKLVLPIRILNRKYEHLPFIREFNDKALNVSSCYVEMENLTRNIKDQFNEYYFALRLIRKTNLKIIQILK